jgi:exodeoxyribonuclease-3
MRLATFNVNSIKARLPRVLEWLEESKPDVVVLQEIKCVDDAFPRLEIEALGYETAVHGQKTYNGVAMLSRHSVEDVRCGLPGDDSDEQARYIEGTVKGVRVCGLYLPNGNPVDDDAKFHYKLGWMDRLVAHIRDTLLPTEMPVVLGGDYNICPTDIDVYNPQGFANDALCRPESRARFRSMINLGLTEAWRALHTEVGYSYWDYQGGRWHKDEGLRIDHWLLSPQAADRLVSCEIDKAPRGREKASDHTPVILELSEADDA